jgi:hypothetical protein
MSENVFARIREKDHAVLQCLREGRNTTRTIREATTLSNRDVNHCFDKLEDLGLVETHTPDGRVTEVIDGQKRNFKAPRRAALTEAGARYFQWASREQTRYRDMTHEELVEQVRALEHDVEALQQAFEAFRQQVVEELE